VAQVAGKLKAMRLLDSSWMVGDDSVIYSKAVKKYQASKGIITTGVCAQLTVKSLNTKDWDFFKTILFQWFVKSYRLTFLDFIPWMR